jgi:serine/threonine protein kinase
MSAPEDLATSREQRLDEVIAAYVQAVEAGQKPDRDELLARHLDLAAELSDYFADQDRFTRLAAPLRAMVSVARSDEQPARKPKEPAAGVRVGYFGDYELMGEIARGGMGIVYKARQRALRRTVALKMIRAVNLASDTDVRRFHAEAEAIANLDHPNIVPIYEIGEFQGQHYFTMKLIDGGSLTQRLADVGLPLIDRETGRDAYGQVWTTQQLAERQADIARLMVTVAQAVQYAHERGLLHRDLKPANILLDAEGRPHVSDFGLAKHLQDDPSLTQSGAIVGTPSYMSPEQATGHRHRLTTAADIYSLGAILYELLTGWPPFRADTPLETLRQVMDRETVRPRTLNSAVNRDLETICLKCLDKDPANRYGSAEVLAADLQAFVDDRPIQARPPTAFGQFWRWCRRDAAHVRRRPRHRGVAIVVVVVLLCLLGWMFLRTVAVQRQRMLAIALEERVRAQAAEADLRIAKETSKSILDQLLSKVSEEMAHAPHSEQADKIKQVTGEIYLKQATQDSEQGRMEQAMAANRKALVLFEQLVAAAPKSTAYRADLARTEHQLGSLLRSAGRRAEAEATFAKALQLTEMLVSDEPSAPDHRAELAGLYSDRGELLADAGKFAEAEQLYRKALALQQKLVSKAPDIAEYRAGLASTLLRLGRLQQKTGRAAEAEQMLRQGQAIQERLLSESADDPALPKVAPRVKQPPQ